MEPQLSYHAAGRRSFVAGAAGLRGRIRAVPEADRRHGVEPRQLGREKRECRWSTIERRAGNHDATGPGYRDTVERSKGQASRVKCQV